MEHEKKQTKENGTISSVGTILKAFYAVVGSIVVLFSTYHGLNSYLDWRIDTKINNADFLKKLARSVRPSLVFDERGSIIADMGAVPFVSNISVSKGPKDSLRIVVSPVEYLGIEPVLEALDGNYAIRTERGQKFDWVFNLSSIQVLTADSSPKGDRQRFRLEIIR